MFSVVTVLLVKPGPSSTKRRSKVGFCQVFADPFPFSYSEIKLCRQERKLSFIPQNKCYKNQLKFFFYVYSLFIFSYLLSTTLLMGMIKSLIQLTIWFMVKMLSINIVIVIVIVMSVYL